MFLSKPIIIFLTVVIQTSLLNFSLAQTADDFYRDGYYKNKAKEYDSSIILFNKAIELNPNDPDYYVSRGDSKAHLKNYSGAMDDYHIALGLDSNNAFAFYNIACIYSLKKDAKNGLLFLQKAIEKGFDNEPDFVNTLKTDPDLAFLRAQKTFQTILKEYIQNQ